MFGDRELTAEERRRGRRLQGDGVQDDQGDASGLITAIIWTVLESACAFLVAFGQRQRVG